MFVLKKLISSLLLPPVGPLLLIACGLLVLRRHRRFGLFLAWSGVSLLLALSLPTVSDLLVRGLPKYPPVKLEAARQAQAIVVLGGGIQTILLVTEGPHMRRSVMAFEAAGMKVIAAPTMLAIRPPVSGTASLFPNAGSLRQSSEVIHEWLGILALRLSTGGQPFLSK